MAGLARVYTASHLLRYVPKIAIGRLGPPTWLKILSVLQTEPPPRFAALRLHAHAMMAHVPSISSSIASSGPGARLCFNRGAIAGTTFRPFVSSTRRRRSTVPVAAAADAGRVIVLTTPEGRKRRVVRPPGAPAMPDAPENALEDFAGCPSDGCSISSAAPDATRAPTSRGARSDVASTDAARARQREQLESMKVAAAPDVRRKRRVLKRLRLEPDAAPVAFDVIEIEEGNCPSDGCSIEAASPATCDEVSDSACDIDGLAARARRGYQSEKHSTEDARERVAFQVAAMRAATEELSRLAAVNGTASSAGAQVVDAATSAKEVLAQKDAFYFSIAGLASFAALRPEERAFAAVTSAASIDPFFNFNPVCPASDGVFRVGQKAALGLAGADNIENYRPLINDVLIRVRTELCVLESFSRETALPFIREKGLGWVLPLHETSETYLAGVVFMVGANFILLGSTKVVAILAIYHDLSVGLVARGAGGLLGMATPEAEAEKREREFSELADAQMAEVKAVMMDAALDRATREAKTAEINARYSDAMERTKEAADVRMAGDETSPLAKARKIAGA